MTYRLGTLGLIAAMVLSLPSHAQDEESSGEEAPASGAKALLGNSLYVSPMFNYIKAADARGTKDGLGGQFAIGKSLTSGLNLELTAGYAMMDGKGGASDAKLTSVGVGAMVFPLTSLPDLYVPVVLQRGQFEKHPGPITDYGTTLFDIGLGYLIGLGDFGALRAEVKYRVDAHGREAAGTTPDQDKHFYEGVASLGLLIPLGSKAAPAAEEAPAEEAPVEIVPAGDADGDGVTDDLDQCPDTPAGTVVNAQGCPDVPAAPACPPPAAGEAIDENGCAVPEKLVLRGVNFELDSAKLTPNAKAILDGVADSLLAVQSIQVEVQGHTSSEASDEYNLKLSDNRAEAVRQYLIGRGVASERMTVKGYGETMPIADNNTEAGRELNRRVALEVTSGGAAAAETAPAAAEEAPAADAAPAEGEVAPTEAAPAAEGEAAPVEGEAAPVEGEAAPVEGETAPAEGEAAPAEGEAAPVEGEAAPAEGEAPTPVEGETAPEVVEAQPAQ